MTFQNFNQLLDTVAALMIDDAPAGPAKGPVTLPADLANTVFATLQDHRETLDHSISRAGAAIAAGHCATCKVEFFDKYFGRAIDGIGPLDRVRCDAAVTLDEFSALCAAAAPVVDRFHNPQPGDRNTAEAEARYWPQTSAALRAEYLSIAREIDLLDPDLEAHGPKFVAYYRRAKAIIAELAHRGGPTLIEGSAEIVADITGRLKVLHHAYNREAAARAAFEAKRRNSPWHPNADEVATRQQHQARIADLAADIKALDGTVEPYRDAGEAYGRAGRAVDAEPMEARN